MFFQKLIFKTLIILFVCIGVSDANPPKEAHKGCSTCHIEEDFKALKTKVSKTCLKCHATSATKDHPIGRVSKVVPDNLPLDEENKLTCITCHEPHGKGVEEKLLRMEFNRLCISCHKNI